MKLNHHDKNRNAATTTLSSEIKLNEEELVTLLRNTYEIQQEQEKKTTSASTSCADIDEEVRKCPICYYEFPKTLNVDGKREHIEQHFT